VEAALGGFLIAAFAQVDIGQIAVAVDYPVQILSLASHLDVCLILLANSSADIRKRLESSFGRRWRWNNLPDDPGYTAVPEFANSIYVSSIYQLAGRGGLTA
jgi:hypothetical protein